MIEQLRVVVADDHPVFRQGLRMLLENLGVSVVAEAGDGATAVAAVEEHRPDVVLMDLQMPGVTGIDATRRIVAAHPDTKVLVLSMVDDDHAVFAAIQAGALGYLLKGAGQAEIRRALEAVGAGEGVYGPAIAPSTSRSRSESVGNGVTAAAPPRVRKARSFRAMAEGLSNGDIAQRLFLSDKTVRNYVSSVFTKLDVESRAEAIVRAREAGLG